MNFTLTSSHKVFLVGSGLLLSFAIGRYTNQQAETTDSSTTVTAEKQQTEIQDHSQVVTVFTKFPSGEEKTVTTISKNVDTNIKETENTTSAETKTATPPSHGLWSISALVGLNPSVPLVPTYGFHVTKKILGPIDAGAFGFTSGLVGISVGISF